MRFDVSDLDNDRPREGISVGCGEIPIYHNLGISRVPLLLPQYVEVLESGQDRGGNHSSRRP